MCALFGSLVPAWGSIFRLPVLLSFETHLMKGLLPEMNESKQTVPTGQLPGLLSYAVA